jgi:hypothetical protein
MTVLVLINELKIQVSACSDDDLNYPKLSKTSMVCKLPQSTLEIFMKLPVEAKNGYQMK